MLTHSAKVLAGLLLTATVANAQVPVRPGIVPGPAGGTLYDIPFPADRYPLGAGFGGGVPGFGGGTVVYPWYGDRPLPLLAGPVIFLPEPAVYAAPSLPGQFLNAALAEREQQATAVRTRTALTVELPTPAELYVNGVKQPGGSKLKHEILNPTLRPGERWDVQVRAGWAKGAQKYTFADQQTLAGGDSKTLLVFNGTPTK